MFMHPSERDDLVLPYDDYEPRPAGLEAPAAPTVDDLVGRLTNDARATYDAVGRDAAMAVVIAVGNYEYISFKRDEVMEAAGALLDEFDPGEGGRTHRWGP